MGEISRTTGMFGENIVNEFLNMIGWQRTSNIEFLCNQKSKHKKKTHDIDFFTSYICPLISDTRADVHISVKYTKIPSSVKSTFVDYANSIINSCECFQHDEQHNNLVRNKFAKKIIRTQVVFWINHQENEDYSLLNSIKNLNSDFSGNTDNLYLVDNKSINFIYKSLKYAELHFSDAKSIDFEYPYTGLNGRIDGGRKTSGKILPVQFLTSPILPLRITTKESHKILMIFLNEPFEEESFKRIMGLAQNLTAGWCNKIIICFPDYQILRHSIAYNNVMSIFSESQFSEMVDVKSFRDNFKSLENGQNLNIYDAFDENSGEFNIETMLPYGDQLRQLLTQSYIYKPELQSLLSKRGVYFNKSTDKNDLIPLLTKSLISPAEFTFLRNKQLSKENAENVVTETLVTTENSSINQVLSGTEMPIQRIVDAKYPNCELIKHSQWLFEKDGTMKLQYDVQRHNLTKDWASQKSSHSGEIIFRPSHKSSDGLSRTNVDIVSTSPETKAIGKELLKEVMKLFKQEGAIKREEQLQKMLVTDFSNKNRTEFLLSFIDVKPEFTSLNFNEITHIDFTISTDKTITLPSDIESLKDRLEDSIFTGRDLQDILYIKDKKYREMFIFYTITVKYFFKSEDLEGSFQVEFGFPDAKKENNDEKADFNFKIIELTPFVQRHTTNVEENRLKVFVKEEFNKLKNYKYENSVKQFGKQLSIMDLIEN